MAIDKKAVAEYIATQSAWQGSRVPELMTHVEQLPHRDIIAAAITASVLQELAYVASHKALTRGDIQAYQEGFLKAAGMTWENKPMGGDQIVRIADQEKKS